MAESVFFLFCITTMTLGSPFCFFSLPSPVVLVLVHEAPVLISTLSGDLGSAATAADALSRTNRSISAAVGTVAAVGGHAVASVRSDPTQKTKETTKKKEEGSPQETYSERRVRTRAC